LRPTEPRDDPNLNAFISDSGYRGNFEAVLTLIKNEGADMVLRRATWTMRVMRTAFRQD
jgi:hypothetical protein